MESLSRQAWGGRVQWPTQGGRVTWQKGRSWGMESRSRQACGGRVQCPTRDGRVTWRPFGIRNHDEETPEGARPVASQEAECPPAGHPQKRLLKQYRARRPEGERPA